jgi:myo-inositol-1(or 4)-monophosphatase
MDITDERLAALRESTATLVREVGDYVYDEWDSQHAISLKDARDIATEVDIESEKRLRTGLGKLFPDAGFIVEEGEDARRPDYNWIIDPLDQTKKYVAKLPMFYVQIGLLDANDNCLLGQLYNPVSGQLFSASRGDGAYINSDKFVAPTREAFDKAIVDVNFSGNTDLPWKLRKLASLAEKYYRIQISSNAFSAYVLTGGVDCFVALADLKDPVDILPRVVIMQEAGLKATYEDIEGRKVWVIANPVLHAKTLALLAAE